MKSSLPKVLHNLSGKPLINHVLGNIREAGIDEMVVVIGYEGSQVQNTVGVDVTCVWQHEQLGTGHAVMQARSELHEYTGNVLIACGDVPLIQPGTFRLLADTAEDPAVGAVVLTMVVDDPTGYGRIVRDDSGYLDRIVEHKDASDEIRSIKEVNTGTYVFNAQDLFNGLATINTDNAQGEYYLPDALQYIRNNGQKVALVTLEDPVEGSGINSREDLQYLESVIQT
jgi:UDP-N-acetylglucosamine diphosphorylase/glucosamine-1-phosphate N-acetyltransferase